MDRPSDEHTAPALGPGRRAFGRYVLDRVLGQGGMGVVWLARDEELGADVALKFIAEHLRWDGRALAGLRREVLKARTLTHPGILRTHDLAIDGNGVAISMEYAAGGSLAGRLVSRLAQEPPCALDPRDLVPILPLLAVALDHAHREAGVVHRDLKPSNILLDAAGEPKIADFGVARSLLESTTRTTGLSYAGTLAYMGPQQLHDELPSPADDIYALGATLYDLLSGSPPFRQGDLAGQIERKVPERISARRLATGIQGEPVPEVWEEAIASCLAKDPRERPSCATEFVARISETAKERVFPGGAKRGRLPRVLAGLAVFSILIGGWIVSRRGASTHVQSGPRSDESRALAAWNFDGDGNDVGGLGLHAIVQRALPTFDRHGRIDRALAFNGATGFTIPDSPMLRWGGSEAFSVSLWVKPGAFAVDIEPLVTSSPDQIGGFAWSLGLGSSRPQIVLGGHASARPITVSALAMIERDSWHHLAVVSDGREVKLFVDGVVQARAMLGEITKTRVPRTLQLRIGFDHDLGSAIFTGALDELRVWRRSLTAGEVTALADRGAPPRFFVSSAVYGDRDDPSVGLRAEFGDAAALAEWEAIRSWHRDDVRALADELGLSVGSPGLSIKHGGRRMFDDIRRYFVDRFDGTVPDYYHAHDELGGRAVVLGSWRGNLLRALVQLPPGKPTQHNLRSADADGLTHDFPPNPSLRAWAATWQLAPGSENEVEVRLRDGRVLSASCRGKTEGGLTYALGEHGRSDRTRQVASAPGRQELVLVAKPGRIALRGKTQPGETVLFAEELVLPGFRASEVSAMQVRGVDAVRIVVE